MAMDKHIGMDLVQMEEFLSKPQAHFQVLQLTEERPDHFIVVNKMTGGSVIQNLHIQNWPVHLFSISSSSDLIMRDMLLDNSAGDAPNNRSNGLAAAHNSDGFDVSSTNNTLITNATVFNQDDCVAVTSGNNITVDSMYCSGGHGLSIGSVGGKSNNIVTNIVVRLSPSPLSSPKQSTNIQHPVPRQHNLKLRKRRPHKNQLQHYRHYRQHNLLLHLPAKHLNLRHRRPARLFERRSDWDSFEWCDDK